MGQGSTPYLFLWLPGKLNTLLYKLTIRLTYVLNLQANPDETSNQFFNFVRISIQPFQRQLRST